MRVTSVEKDRSVERRVPSRVPKERKRFTPWLEDQINQGDIDGLGWIEKEKGIFRVPWVRVDKPEFELETHAELFKRWEQHTGKYRQGDQPHPSTWKTRFRCALRKMQEIVEIKELGSLGGSKPYRAFKFKAKLKGLYTIQNGWHNLQIYWPVRQYFTHWRFCMEMSHKCTLSNFFNNDVFVKLCQRYRRYVFSVFVESICRLSFCAVVTKLFGTSNFIEFC